MLHTKNEITEAAHEQCFAVLAGALNAALRIKIKFEGSVTGRRMRRSLFRGTDEFSNTLAAPMASSNAAVIQAIKEAGHRFTSSKKKKVLKEKRQVEMEDLEVSAEHTDSTEYKTIEQRFLGTYNIPCAKLTTAPENLRVREIEAQWVKQIKDSLEFWPGKPITRIPINLEKPELTRAEFKEDMMSTTENMYVLGGNHLLSAMKQVLREHPDDPKYHCLRTVEVDAYLNLETDMALFVASVHNKRTQQKSINFQDKVVLARNVRDTKNQAWKSRVADVLGCISKEKCTVESLGTVLSVADYDKDEYEATMSLFEDYRQHHVSEPGKSFPQNLFRGLQGIKAGRLGFLRDALGTNGIKQANKARSLKIRENYRRAFATLVQADSWEAAELEHEAGCRKVDELAEQEKSVKRKYVPKELIELAEKCNAFQDIGEEYNIEIKVKKHDNDVSKNENVEKIIEKHRISMMKEIKKISITGVNEA